MDAPVNARLAFFVIRLFTAWKKYENDFKKTLLCFLGNIMMFFLKHNGVFFICFREG